MQIEHKSIKNILAVRNDRFGEFLLNIPALRALKETFINAKIIAVINPYVKELAKCIPFIDEIIEWPQGQKHSLWERLQLIRLLKVKKIDIAVMLNPSKEFNIFTYFTGIPIRVGYARKWDFLLTHKIEDRKYLGEKHEIEYNLDLVSLVGAKTEDKRLSLVIDDAAEVFGIKNEDNFIALHPFTSDPIKQWPIENFIALADKLTKELNLKIAVIGGKEEEDKGRQLFGDGENLLNLTGKTTLKQLAGFLKKCKLLVSGDSGPMHLACCVGTPVIAIFRNDIPEKCSRRWGPWRSGNIVIEKNNLYNISVQEVFDKVKERLGK